MVDSVSGSTRSVGGLTELAGERLRGLRRAFDAFPEPLGALAALRDEREEIVDFAVVYANPALARLTGLAARLVVAPRLLEIVPAFGAAGHVRALADVVESERLWQQDVRFEGDVAGRRGAGLFELRAVRFGDGALCLFRDVTEVRRAERELERIAAVVEFTDDAIVTADPEGRITHWNASAERLLGYCRAEILGRRVRRLVREVDYPEQSARFADVLAGRRIDRIETQWVRKDGTPVDVVLTASPIYDRAGAITGVSAVVHDISTRKRMEAELRRSNAELEQFATFAAHDLREPLVAIIQGARALNHLSGDDLAPHARELAGHLENAAAHGLRLIDALRDYSRVGHVAPRQDTVDLGAVVGDVLAALRSQLERSAARVTVGRLPTVTGDPGELARVFQNLIANAVNYRSKAPPSVTIAAARAEGWTISVEDSGIGVRPTDAAHIFDLFARGHARSEHGGVGIGLAVCRKIIERHGGRIWVEQSSSGGSAFRFTLPADGIGAAH